MVLVLTLGDLLSAYTVAYDANGVIQKKIQLCGHSHISERCQGFFLDLNGPLKEAPTWNRGKLPLKECGRGC